MSKKKCLSHIGTWNKRKNTLKLLSWKNEIWCLPKAWVLGPKSGCDDNAGMRATA